MVSKCQRWSNRGTEIRGGGEFMCLPLADRVLRSTQETIEIFLFLHLFGGQCRLRRVLTNL